MAPKNDDFLERIGAVPPAPIVVKNASKPTVHKICAVEVQVIESERGWGSKIDETKIFNNLADAEKFVNEFNSHNTESSAPDWYMYAQISKKIGC